MSHVLPEGERRTRGPKLTLLPPGAAGDTPGGRAPGSRPWGTRALPGSSGTRPTQWDKVPRVKTRGHTTHVSLLVPDAELSPLPTGRVASRSASGTLPCPARTSPWGEHDENAGFRCFNPKGPVRTPNARGLRRGVAGGVTVPAPAAGQSVRGVPTPGPRGQAPPARVVGGVRCRAGLSLRTRLVLIAAKPRWRGRWARPLHTAVCALGSATRAAGAAPRASDTAAAQRAATDQDALKGLGTQVGR